MITHVSTVPMFSNFGTTFKPTPSFPSFFADRNNVHDALRIVCFTQKDIRFKEPILYAHYYILNSDIKLLYFENRHSLKDYLRSKGIKNSSVQSNRITRLDTENLRDRENRKKSFGFGFNRIHGVYVHKEMLTKCPEYILFGGSELDYLGCSPYRVDILQHLRDDILSYRINVLDGLGKLMLDVDFKKQDDFNYY